MLLILMIMFLFFRKTGMGGTIRTTGDDKNDDSNKGVNKKQSCYIMQDDQLNPLFSVFEIMLMAADLKLSPAVSLKAKKLAVSTYLLT